MNERIRHLIEQHERINNLYIIGPVQKAEVEDFVEAIVRECVALAEEAQADFYIVHNIKSHFGIE